MIIAIKSKAVTFSDDKSSFTWATDSSKTIFPTKCELTMQLNTIWSLHIEIPNEENVKEYVYEESLISVDIGDMSVGDETMNKYQLFRVTSCERTPYLITCECSPIFIDCQSVIIEGLRAVNCTPTQALGKFFNSSKYGYSTHNATTPVATAYWEWIDMMSALNGDADNSFINRWGGEFFFDNYRLVWQPKLDRFQKLSDDEILRITASMNMTGIEYTVDTSELITEIWPQAYNGRHYRNSQDRYVSIKSPHFDDYAVSHASIIKYENIKLAEDAGTNEDEDITVCETYDDLNRALEKEVEKEWNENEVDIPSVSYSVNFIDLSRTPEYQGYEDLVELHLGDSVRIYNDDIDVDTRARVIGITYDCINRIITDMILGDYQQNYFERSAKQNRTADAVINTAQNGANAESLVGVSDGTKTQIQATTDVLNKNAVQVLKVENLMSGTNYGAMAIGSDGIQVTRERLSNDSGWNWDDSVILNQKGVFYGKLGNKNISKYIQVNNDGLKSYDGGVSGQGITGTITVDSFSTVNGVVVGKSDWTPITYKISIVDNVLTLTDSNGNMSSVTLPETKTILTGDTGNGIKSAVLNDDYTLTLTWTNGESYTTPSIRGAQGIQGEQGVQGVKGDKGDKGDSTTITSYKVEYQEGTSSTQAPTGTWYTKPMDVLQGNYLWTRITTNYSDGTVIQSYSIARYGVDGGQGVAGKGISSVVAYYLATGLSSGVTKDSDGWTTTVQNVTSTKKYLWKYELTTWSTGETTTTNPIIIGTYGDKGDKGDNGAQGIKGETGADGKTSYIHIAYANSSDGKIGFSVSNPNGKSYIGHYVDYEENDSTDPTKYTWSKYVGDNGNGIESITNYYGVSASGDTQPTGWSTTIQATNNETPYLWCYEVVTYTDGDTTSTEPRVISIYTSDMASMKPYYYLSTSNDSTNFVEVDGHEWADTIPSASELNGKDSDGNDIPYYVWEKFIMTMSDGTTKETDPTLYGMYTDIQDAINTNANAIATVSSSVTTSINQAKDSILTQVRSDYVLQDSLNEYKQQMESSIQQTNSSITTTISELNQVSSKIDGLEQTSENVNSYMKFSTDGLELGKSDSQFKTNITNDRMSFTQNGNEVAYFSNNKMYVTDGEFTNSLHIGKFAFVPRANGSLDFKKVSD